MPYGAYVLLVEQFKKVSKGNPHKLLKLLRAYG